MPSTVVHGEYRLGNLLARDDEIVAIIDWELWSREDPRVDLSWFLSYLDADEQPSAIRPTPEGMPTRAEILAVYEDGVGHAVADLAWFDAHARFKMAAIAAVVNKHNRRREQPDPGQEALVPRDRRAPGPVGAAPRAFPEQEVVRALRVDRRHRGDHR